MAKATPAGGAGLAPNPKTRLFDQVREVMRFHHYSIHTERSYIDWIKRYVRFHQMQSREDLKDGVRKIEAYLTHLAVNGKVAPATQNQAMNALVSLYKKVLQGPLEQKINAVRADRKVNVPVVLTRNEVARPGSLLHARDPRKSAGLTPGYPHHSGVAGTPGRNDHDDLHACAPTRGPRRSQPAGRPAGRGVVAQFIGVIKAGKRFDQCVRRYRGDHRVRSLPSYEPFLVMGFAQLTCHESWRDIETCLRALGSKLYHSGIRQPTARSTLADANEKRDGRLFSDFAHVLIEPARSLYAEEPFGAELKPAAYALDSTTLEKNSVLPSQRNRLVNEHHRNVVADGIKKLVVLADQTAVDLFSDELSGAVPQLAGRDLPVQFLHQRRIRQGDGLAGLRTAHNLQQFRIDHNCSRSGAALLAAS